MKKLGLLLIFLLSIVSVHAIATNSADVSVIVDASSDGVPYVHLDPDTRILYTTAPGRIENVKRQGNYAFEGEQLRWDVLVWDRNGIEDITTVQGAIGPSDDPTTKWGEVGCFRNGRTSNPNENGAVDEAGKPLLFDPATMIWYTCKLTVEPRTSLTGLSDWFGEAFIAVQAIDKAGNVGEFVEDEFFFLNPVIAVDFYGSANKFNFGEVKPGVTAYSNTVIITNEASKGSGVQMRFRISGTDFYDSSPNATLCRGTNSNVLPLTAFKYNAYAGSHSTNDNPVRDAEGYSPIHYDTGNYKDAALIFAGGGYVSEGGKVPIRLKLEMPNACSGNYDDGDIFFYGEII